MKTVDFKVSVPQNRDPVILQITDTQIIDSSKMRTPDRLGEGHIEAWGPDKKERRCYGYLREIVNSVSPDLILVTGDNVYGEFDDDGGSMLEFVDFMESFDIPWAPIFGNHDNESKMGADWQSKQFENAKNCLFLQRELTGNGNYTVGIEQGGRLTRVFFMLDTNGCGNASEASLANGHTVTHPCIAEDQREWYTSTAKKIAEAFPDVKLSAAMHIQLAAFNDAFAKYCTPENCRVNIDALDEKQEGDFGYIGYMPSVPIDGDGAIFNSLKSLGFDSIFVGHEHANSASIVFEGVRLQYGMKSSGYDSLNYVDDEGNIESSYYSFNTPLVGGTVFSLSRDGEIVDPHIYYCKCGKFEI